jgi:hypothetical protein
VAVEDLLARTAPRLTLLARGGFQGFIDTGRSAGLSDPTAAFGLSLWIRDVPLPRLSLAVDVSYGGGPRKLVVPAAGPDAIPFNLTVLELGLAAPYSTALGPIRISMGPRFAAVYLARRFDLSAYSGTQHELTITPGILLGASYAINDRFEAAAIAHASFVYVHVDDVGRSLGLAEVWLCLGYRF